MKSICRELQERLAGDGAQAIRDDAAAQHHLEGCAECYRVLEQLARLDEALGVMPAHDAPEPIVSNVLMRVASEPTTTGEPTVAPKRWLESLSGAVRPSVRRPLLWGLSAAAGVMLMVAIMTPSLLRARIPVPRPSSVPDSFIVDKTEPLPPTTLGPGAADTKNDAMTGKRLTFREELVVEKNGQLTKEEAEKLRDLGYVADAPTPARQLEQAKGQEGQGGRSPSGTVGLDGGGAKVLKSPTEESPRSRTDPAKESERANDLAARRDLRGRLETKTGEKDANKKSKPADLEDARGVEDGVAGDVAGGVAGGLAAGDKAVAQPPAPVRVGGTIKAPKRVRHVEPAYPDAARDARVQGPVILEIEIDVTGEVKNARVLRSKPLLDAAAIEAVKQWVYTPTVLNGQAVPVLMTVTVDFRPPAPPVDGKDQSSTQPAIDPTRAFLEERAATEGLSFQHASGYWANTYLPGDPVLRLLHARLRDWDRSSLQARVGLPLGLHDVAAQPAQPFDPPVKAGLAVYLSADRRGLDGPSRMLLQVGFKGSPRLGGQRPPMSVGIVLDLRGDVPTEAAADMRAVALAFAEARQVGDRFSLIVAGRSGGVVVGPEKFKHGRVAVAIDQLMAGNTSQAGPTLELPGAVAAAFLEAARCGDPEASLGGSAVVLVTGQPLGGDAHILGDLAHQGAVAGMRLSVVSIAPTASSPDLERLALAGQGSRRVLDARSDAPRLVEAELTAASDIVARAIRLRIRLAPGVRLVEIVGSRRLDEAQAQRVREAERSIDLRLSRLLGIDSDRGEDEDGIQIVIPSFHASDAHVILLDIVAPGSGAIADVSVRYKDVVFLRNGVARTSLSLPAGEQAIGPRERNVLKNLLALRLADRLAAAGSALDAGDAVRAAAVVEQARAMRAGLLANLPGLAGDVELSRDVAMVREYAQLFASDAAAGPQLAYIADSLRYAGRLKLLPRPAPLGVGVL